VQRTPVALRVETAALDSETVNTSTRKEEATIPHPQEHESQLKLKRSDTDVI
jgi:hypothetical protein